MPSSATLAIHFDAVDVIGFHAQLFGLTPEQAADHLRSREVLEGALARPRHHGLYGGADLAAQAAVLAHGIAEGQPFVDGNKRTALVTMCAFLAANDLGLAVSPGRLAAQVYRLSDDLSAEGLATWLRESLVARGSGER